MARPASPPYTLGKITLTAHPTKVGMVQARGYYRDGNNARKEVTAPGKTEAGAKSALARKVNALRDTHQGGDTVLRQDTKMPAAAAVWLDWKSREDKSPNTMRDYRGYVERSINVGALANLTVVQANDVARIESWLTTIADERGETAARQSRKVLSGILGLAERRGAIPASVMHRAKTPKAKPGSTGDRKCTDSECDYDCGKRHLDTRRAFTQAEAAAVLDVADSTKADLGDLAHFLFGTGVRISEALHCTSWDDVNLDAQTVRVRGTKTKHANRTLGLSDDLTERLRERAANYGTTGLVFGVTYFTSKLGAPRDRNNVSKALRRAFATADVKWAGTHTFRRTVATWMDDAGHSLASIANQLGHSDTNVTAKYLGRQDTATHAAAVMVLPSRPSTTRLRVVSGG
ncbi:tyrosine-type recombinase/integrase [Nocardioides dongxiaopingii]|uniref:tyrosine-type recombinase/integrase n=1 Tax=Nocardioides dongxiaopingii TaxID=2576036 RepID=UPI0010C761B6|nr:site-specific integrase [Nocardioides dongxiaopingii]